jgi:hypothetical protein
MDTLAMYAESQDTSNQKEFGKDLSKPTTSQNKIMAIIVIPQSKNDSTTLTQEDINSIITALSPIITLPEDSSWENVTGIQININSSEGYLNIQNKI